MTLKEQLRSEITKLEERLGRLRLALSALDGKAMPRHEARRRKSNGDAEKLRDAIRELLMSGPMSGTDILARLPKHGRIAVYNALTRLRYLGEVSSTPSPRPGKGFRSKSFALIPKEPTP